MQAVQKQAGNSIPEHDSRELRGNLLGSPTRQELIASRQSPSLQPRRRIRATAYTQPETQRRQIEQALRRRLASLRCAAGRFGAVLTAEGPRPRSAHYGFPPFHTT